MLERNPSTITYSRRKDKRHGDPQYGRARQQQPLTLQVNLLCVWPVWMFSLGVRKTKGFMLMFCVAWVAKLKAIHSTATSRAANRFAQLSRYNRVTASVHAPGCQSECLREQWNARARRRRRHHHSQGADTILPDPAFRVRRAYGHMVRSIPLRRATTIQPCWAPKICVM